ncbi:Ig-like domain-containing protein [Paenibacillus sp. MMS20-IR301]|uniref:Ig-like domain-containing protein n=1 Tax=Paenibacillus sp. MMS20-IR301 TaxID=2895946 RepID=UPI0028EA67DE|nr:Ig-like domain-containing protein [Paenibacillus sp. MMS20-IR301]WNS42649.1 Ig-like domain-containing protein [Paenibacillus sp. MMS20-IR301]
MSDMSYPTKEKSQFMNVQGGEKKVMKKILSVALSTAMAFSMFASVAFGETAKVTPEQAFNALAAKGILNGYPDGQAHLEKDLTRAEFAKIVTKLFGLTEVTGKLSYKDKGYTATNWAVPYIEAVSAANLMQGKDTVKGIFDYNGKVTVEEVAAVLFRALKLETPTTTDNSASAWAKGYAQAVINAGLVAQSTNFKANATRSLVVETAYAVDQIGQQATLTVASAEAVSPTSVVVTFSDKTTTTVTLTTPLVEGVETTVPFKHLEKDYTAKVTLAAPKVVAVEAPNAKQLVVKFNRAIDKDTVIDSDKLITDVIKVVNVSGQAVVANGASAAFNSADTELTITFNVNEYDYLKGQYTVVVTDAVETAAGTAVPTYSTLISVADTVAPTVKAINAVAKTTTNKVYVQFSEPVKPAGIIATVNGVAASVYRESADTFSLTAGTLNSGTTYDVSLTNVSDYASNVAAPIKTSVAVVSDTAAPTIVSITPVSDQYVNVKFNKKVSFESFSGNVGLLKADGDKIGNMILKSTADSDTIKLQVPSNFDFPSSGTFTGTLQFGATVRDTLGNTLGTALSQQISLTKDSTAPSVASATYGAKGLVITFNEDIEFVGATVRVINNATGAYVTSALDFSGQTVSGAKLTYPKVTGLSGDYTLRIEKGLVKDLSKAANVSAATAVVVSAATTTTNDTTRPTVSSITYTEASVDEPGYIEFNVYAQDAVGLNVASLREASSYTLGSKALPSGSFVVVERLDKGAASSALTSAVAKVFVPKAGISKTEAAEFVAFGIADTAGNIATVTDKAVIKPVLKDGVAPVLTAAAVNTGNTSWITLTFTENVTGVTKADFTVLVNNEKVTVTDAIKGTGSDAGKWHLTVAGYSDLNASNVNAIKVTVNAKDAATGQVDAAFTDEAGNKVTTGTVVYAK